MVATILNNFLNELIVANTVIQPDGSPEVRPRADISVLSYEGDTVRPALAGSLAEKSFVSLPELQMNPIAIEMRKKLEMDDTGNTIELQVPFPIWVRPKSGGGTPMCKALNRARELAEEWVISHSENYPPVVINVTDGMATDGDPMELSRRLCRVSTRDGEAMLFNVHITSLSNLPITYPADEAELPNDQYAKQLFSMSSIIPESSRALLDSLVDKAVSPGARGLIFNGDASSIRLMFMFASVPATRPLDSNR